MPRRHQVTAQYVEAGDADLERLHHRSDRPRIVCRSLGRVSRSQPCTATLWLPRALLVLLTLTGLGIWQDGHCIDGVSAHHAMSVSVLSTGSGTITARAGIETTAAPAMAAHHRDVNGPGLSSTTADICYIAPTLITHTTMTAIPVFQAFERAAPIASSSRASMSGYFAPGVALTRLGVSRT